MRLSELIETLPAELTPSEWLRDDGSDDPLIRGMTYDSRKVAPGDLFFALRGTDSDGHDYVEKALELGAVALVVERAPDRAILAGRPAVVVPDSRRALAPLATRFFGEPASELDLVGITGTNGKTSTAYLVESILGRAGQRTGLIGTVEIRYAGERQSSINTTPESLDLQRMLRAMCTHNVESAIMEVSSHGLALERVRGCEFAVAAITNVTQDHLDFHGDMESYVESKTLLFERHLASDGAAVINLDDPNSERFRIVSEARGVRVIGVTRNASASADVHLLSAEIGIEGSSVRLRVPQGELEVRLPLVGDFNLENLLVACGIACALEIAPEVIAEGVAACPQVPGRMEVVASEKGDPTVIVDYAHTPDAVEKLLSAVRPLCSNRMITVFGCGGDRDRSKRPLMAEAVARLSDCAIATSDNPRTEDPLAILRDVEKGLSTLNKVDPGALDASESAYASMPDRQSAIQHAISIAGPADTVVLAGKGHEDYQIIGSRKFPFDDREEAKRALAERHAS